MSTAQNGQAPAARDLWLTPGVRGIGAASLLADIGHEVPTALLPSLLTSTLGAPASALGPIEGVSDGLAGAARLGGGALADDPHRRRAAAVGGYTITAVLSGLIGAATSAWQVGVLRASPDPPSVSGGRCACACARYCGVALAGCSRACRSLSSATSPPRC